ncbi:hypothetical protein L1S32_06335 [Methanogenium sp. S4BF]|uniref:hypothetical protein n=1 Tax=Methanogenium sp. S4BF TaxID=1789226 RepID=UPI002417D5D5|nr:hypothetical protein [Methanogenium sp. S4BF]WFN33476.1 hypothetical protein L1S32_06335 [Methanogenium sp. S4BF]
MSNDEYWFEVESERIEIDGVEYDLENSLHVIVDGVEYLDIDGERYELQNNSKYAPDSVMGEEPSGEGSSILSSIIAIAIILIIGVVIFKGAAFAFNMATSDEVASAAGDISDMIVTGSKVAVDNIETKIDGKTESAASKQADLIVEAMDYTNPTTRDYALMQIDSSHGGEYNIAQICDVWENVYNRWTYVNDPKGFEYFSPASRTINLGLKGDCDDFAIVVGSVMQSIGGYPRIILAHNSNGSGHAYAELKVASSKQGLQNIANYICKRYHCSSIAYHTDHTSDGDPIYWLNLDWQSRHPGGKFWENDGETLIVYPNGYVKKYN